MMIFGLDWHAWVTVFLILGMFVTLLRTKLPADIVFLAVVALLLITGCLPEKEVLSGFSSSTVVVVGVLFFVVTGLEQTGVLHWVVKHLLGTPKSFGRAILRLMLPVAFLSALLSNTTVVALFINVVKMWAKKLSIAPSKLLIPLSYAAGMGGVCTLIGTPPNLLISGFYTDACGETLSIFTTTLPGLFCLVVGIVTIIVLQKLIPTRKSPEEELLGNDKSAVHYLYVPSNGHLPGQTLGELGMIDDCRRLNMLGIVHFDGEVEHFSHMSNEEAKGIFLLGTDTMIFTGNNTEVQAFGRKHGLKGDKMVEQGEVKTGFKTLLSSLIMLAMVLLSAFEVIPLVNSCMLAAIFMLVTRCSSIKQAKDAVNWDVLMVFAASVTLGKAIDATGLAQILTDQMTSLCDNNALVALIVICFLGTFLTEFVSNTACGAIMAPVAIKIATSLGANPLTFCVGLMISVSSSFATPIGSPTHLMVYVPGGYRFADFLRIGLPMNFIILAANIIITLLLFPL